MVVTLLYAMQSPCNCFTLSLSGSDNRRSNKLARRQRCYDGDHTGAPVTMEIMTVLWRWRLKAQDDDGHIMSHIELHVMLILLCILFCLGRR
jgi:hypothetical protein